MQQVGFYTYRCDRCGHVFGVPFLGDGPYGETILYGERGTLYRYVSIIDDPVDDHPVWRVIVATLPEDAAYPKDYVRPNVYWRVLAALADPVDGQRLQPDAVCPGCQAGRTHFRELPNPLRMSHVENATFAGFLALTASAQRERVLTVAATVA